jgi:NAD(P)-dependent dehydrogenase (short-subunit alcohol dehydrogenase family)
MTEIAGKAALVTGGGSGIGRGLVLALAAEGASVVVADIVMERAAEVAAEVQKVGGAAVAVACDVSDRESVRKMKAQANEAFGPVSLLFANAGVTWFDRLADMKESDIDWVLQVNLMGTINCMHTFLPDMISAREGHVVATASNAGLISGWVPDHSVYSATKAGIIGLMSNMAIELAEFGVGSTVYCPGGVRGQIGESIRFRPDRFGGPDPSAVLVHRASDGALGTNAEWLSNNIVGMFDPEDVGPMVMHAVKTNAPIVVDHANQRQYFLKYVVDPALAAFDEAEAFEKLLGERG